jgi:NADH-ubiquinone oxidoreductase chain 4
LYLGLDGLSIYFVMLTTIITPIALLSNWNSINNILKMLNFKYKALIIYYIKKFIIYYYVLHKVICLCTLNVNILFKKYI